MLDGWSLLWLDGHVKSLMDICGACERIRYTPLSSSYRALLRHGIALYVLISPFYLIEDIGPSSFPLFVLAAYFLLGIEMVAEEIEEPFGASGDNLPLEHYCAKIEASVREILPAPVDVATAGCVIKISVIPTRIGLPFSRSRASFSCTGVSRPISRRTGRFPRTLSPTEEEGDAASESRLVLIGYVCPRVPMSG